MVPLIRDRNNKFSCDQKLIYYNIYGASKNIIPKVRYESFLLSWISNYKQNNTRDKQHIRNLHGFVFLNWCKVVLSHIRSEEGQKSKVGVLGLIFWVLHPIY